MLASFAENWLECTGERLALPPATTARQANLAVLIASSTAGSRPTTMQKLVHGVIGEARERLWLTSAYFVPSDRLTAALIQAAGRGVDVRVLTNGPLSNHKVTRLAGRASYAHLLAGGVQIYEYAAGMHHAKVITADSRRATIGSTNLDDRSLVLNDELNAAVVDAHIVSALDRQFLEDLEHSQHIQPGSWHLRSALGQLAEAGANLFRAQL
jgi:cardiolipin synthase